MYLSPWTWGSNDLRADYDCAGEELSRVKVTQRQNFKERRKTRAKERNDVPHFVALVDEILVDYPLAPYLTNPLSKAALSSKLGEYVSHHFNWNTFPEDVDIGLGTAGRGGQLPSIRVQRKRQQLDNIMAFVVPFIHSSTAEQRKVVVDFCCGCGHQSIPLAFLFPNVSFVLIDTNDRSLEIAKNRVKRLHLTNVRFITDNIQNFNEEFDVGISLHACGVATDIAVQKSVLARAVYVSIPCCVGKIAHYDSNRQDRSCGDVSYPRSTEYISAGCSLLKYLVLAKAADYGHHGYDVGGQSEHVDCENGGDAVDSRDVSGDLTAVRRLAKRVIEQDRNFYARSHEYKTYMTVCHPLSCTPKNDVIIGIPQEKPQNVNMFEQWIAVRVK